MSRPNPPGLHLSGHYVMLILICAQVLTLAFRGLPDEAFVPGLFALMPGGVAANIWFGIAIIFVLEFSLSGSKSSPAVLCCSCWCSPMQGVTRLGSPR